MGKPSLFQKCVTYILIVTLSYFSFGCATYTSPFVYKTEEELNLMEYQAEQMNYSFRQNYFVSARKKLMPLCAEQTVSRPLYQLELLSVLLLEGKKEEAHALMVDIQRDLEMLFDEESEELATSFWHGEQNKVFKGDTHERAIFYALFAMSFIERGEYEEALRCVKNGLLADISTEDNEKSSDFGLLHYLGYVAARYAQDDAQAEEYKREFLATLSLQKRNVRQEGNVWLAMVENEALPTDFLVVWSGYRPTYLRGGEYGEIRHVVPGYDHISMLTVETTDGVEANLSRGLGDVNYQATTRGGREMDEVLANKALLKSGFEASGNIFILIGIGVFSSSAMQNNANAMLLLAGVGLGCLLIGSGFHVAGALVNSEADVRYWKNLPANFSIIPLYLPRGEQHVLLNGYYVWDQIFQETCTFAGEADKVEVKHHSVLPYCDSEAKAFYQHIQTYGARATSKLTDRTWMQYEVTE